MSRRSTRFRHQSAQPPAALVVALQEPHGSAHRSATSALELARLARTLGIEVVRTVCQPGVPALIRSEDRMRELAVLTGGPGLEPERPRDETETDEAQVDLVLVDGPLTASQQRTLMQALGVEVIDRTALILRIFTQRARTHEAQLQVELAARLYRAPRIRDERGLSDRQGGGGRGGRGHTNVELEKQRNRDRIATLRRELESGRLRTERTRRERPGPHVALVGYTNAGKSSLMRALTGRDVHIADELFATLGHTVGVLDGTREPNITVSDTVGFIASLPHELVASFHATLEEARHADLLLVVGDASDPDLPEQLHVTDTTLRQIGAGEVPRMVLLNKADRLTPAQRETVCWVQNAQLVSAHDADDMAALREQLRRRFEPELVEGELLVPYDQGSLIATLHAQGRVVSQRFTARGTTLRLRAPRSAWTRVRASLAGVPRRERRA